MIIEIHILNDNGTIITSGTRESYESAGKFLLSMKTLIKELEAGESGIKICSGCDAEFVYGEDRRVDAGMVCSSCAKSIG